MIPPSQQMRQAMLMQRAMGQGQQPDPLMQALSRQAMMGDMLKQTATHKMKMLKLKQKYAAQLQPQGQVPPQSGGPMGGNPNGGY